MAITTEYVQSCKIVKLAAVRINGMFERIQFSQEIRKGILSFVGLIK
ncbi:hypothetical protein HanRHA438_Chr05g0241821 [Helianthus annuus]|uniref:Uncharacterized protein n=1 Tax=Helianthus annuus TaxID=4232 RepID=A0A9K3J243_HELAN|nr:hypothetical protein HanXRQr2_Chr05g0232571 [Helianthus annuus]KAJ0585845.1 hypothetical protein HanHA89_Chr05g0205321 [Helianthus annuus]KAJ0920480.1 hypothetical protein HanRHA438_Chr05g0241821 [Helianthus annuus]KAJ0924098.1 hypothetical protein HanPSC8_Chr05g0224321 [Helianthus annuus]